MLLCLGRHGSVIADRMVSGSVAIARIDYWWHRFQFTADISESTQKICSSLWLHCRHIKKLYYYLEHLSDIRLHKELTGFTQDQLTNSLLYSTCYFICLEQKCKIEQKDIQLYFQVCKQKEKTWDCSCLGDLLKGFNWGKKKWTGGVMAYTCFSLIGILSKGTKYLNSVPYS